MCGYGGSHHRQTTDTHARRASAARGIRGHAPLGACSLQTSSLHILLLGKLGPLRSGIFSHAWQSSSTFSLSTMSREELRNVRMVQAFAAAEAQLAQRESKKMAALNSVGIGKSQNCCSEAPCFVATEHDLMNLTEYLNQLAPAVIEAGIIKITVPEELRVKYLPCSKPAASEFPCKVQVMRCSSKHEGPGSANLVGHHFGKTATTTLENLKRRTKKLRASFG